MLSSALREETLQEPKAAISFVFFLIKAISLSDTENKNQHM